MAQRIKEEIFVERHPIRGFVIYEISEEHLEQLERETLSVGEDFSFFLACLTTAISLTASMVSFSVPEGKLYASFFIITVLGYVGAVYFGYRWRHSRREFKSIVTKIKEGAGPLGDEETVLKPEELANLRSQAAKPKETEES